ncbi:MAG: Cof-type HAD-IIB family hydrolase [Oscillospiraceae bacterium]|nr:Cof-type HAD-IIB family hydrolase [Oscillospiraceae bacterium]
MIESLSDILIISDVDGTLLREKTGISKENLEAIKRFTDKGGYFTVSTGRAIDVAMELLKDIPINAPSVHINGGYFYDWKQNKIIEPHYISKYARFCCKKVVEKFSCCDCHFAAENSVNLLTSGKYLRKYIPEREFHFFDGSFDDIPGEVYKYIICCDPENMAEIRKYAESVAGRDIKIIQSSPFFLEILPPENSKGASLKRLCEIIGIPSENSVAAGDYENDSEMILAAGIGAAVENAQEGLKAIADIILPSCEENAIAHLIEFLEEMYE